MGDLDTDDVYHFYEDNRIDVFVNASRSEGAPVSIMEAMSFHIPVVAPKVGGIGEMVDHGVNGFLLDVDWSTGDLAGVLARVDFFKNSQVRRASHDVYVSRYKSESNYVGFISMIDRCHETNATR
jgi:glycosyltransferase involved in cell wall biosynthesis